MPVVTDLIFSKIKTIEHVVAAVSPMPAASSMFAHRHQFRAPIRKCATRYKAQEEEGRRKKEKTGRPMRKAPGRQDKEDGYEEVEEEEWRSY